jgi:hypothetical protein
MASTARSVAFATASTRILNVIYEPPKHERDAKPKFG